MQMDTEEFLQLLDYMVDTRGVNAFFGIFERVKEEFWKDPQMSPPEESFFPYGTSEQMVLKRTRNALIDIVNCYIGVNLVGIEGVLGASIKYNGHVYVNTEKFGVIVFGVDEVKSLDFIASVSEEDKKILSTCSLLGLRFASDWRDFKSQDQTVCEVFSHEYPLRGLYVWEKRYQLLRFLGSYLLKKRLDDETKHNQAKSFERKM